MNNGQVVEHFEGFAYFCAGDVIRQHISNGSGENMKYDEGWVEEYGGITILIRLYSKDRCFMQYTSFEYLVKHNCGGVIMDHFRIR